MVRLCQVGSGSVRFGVIWFGEMSCGKVRCGVFSMETFIYLKRMVMS